MLPVCGVIPGKGVLDVGIGRTGAFADVVGIGIRLGDALDTFGVGIDTVPGRGTGPLTLDEFGTGIGPSATLSDGDGVGKPDGLFWLDTADLVCAATGGDPPVGAG